MTRLIIFAGIIFTAWYVWVNSGQNGATFVNMATKEFSSVSGVNQQTAADYYNQFLHNDFHSVSAAK